VSAAEDPLPSDPGGDPAEERVRLFVALELPGDVREALAGWRDRVMRGADGLRAIAPEALHATLCFLGWRSTAQIGAIGDACGVLAAQPAPELRLGEAIWLPRRRPRVLAVELGDIGTALARAQAVLSEVLEVGGWYEPDGRPYLGHVTVARVSQGTRLPRRSLPALPEVDFRASRVTLYRSRLSRSGARYEALATVALAG
jgi:2'-5' RNA ligase